MPTSVKDEVGDVEASLDIDGLPDSVAEYARDVLGETPENKVRTLQELSDLIYGKSCCVTFFILIFIPKYIHFASDPYNYLCFPSSTLVSE